MPGMPPGTTWGSRPTVNPNFRDQAQFPAGLRVLKACAQRGVVPNAPVAYNDGESANNRAAKREFEVGAANAMVLSLNT